MREINLFQQTAIDEEEEIHQAPVVEQVAAQPEKKEVRPASPPRPPVERLDARTHVERQDTRLQMKRVIEALLFASREPLTLEKIREVTDTIQPLPPREVRALIQTLQD